MEPIMIKLHDLASPSRKNLVFDLPSMGERSSSERFGNKKDTSSSTGNHPAVVVWLLLLCWR